MKNFKNNLIWLLPKVFYSILILYSATIFSQPLCSGTPNWNANNRCSTNCGLYYDAENVVYNGKIYSPRYSSTTAPLSDPWNRDETAAGWRQWAFVSDCVSCTNGTANAGSNLSVCQGATSGALGGSIGGGATGGTWTASSGTVNNPTNVANATYTANGSSGNVTLTLTTSGGCASVQSTKTITVTAFPTIVNTTPAARCGTGTVTLGTTASAGTINWYAAATGGSSLGSGTSFTTPSISATTIYYVDATSNGCTTATRTAVTATVSVSPTISLSESSVCVGSNITANREWTPANIGADLKLWLDAADGSTITQSSNLVSRWNDKSGNGNNAIQATGINQPTYTNGNLNGLPVITFNGSTSKMASILSASSSSETIFGVFRSAGNTATFLGSSSHGGRQFRNEVTGQLGFIKQYVVNLALSGSGNTIQFNAPMIAGITYNSSTTNFYNNGSTLGGSISVNPNLTSNLTTTIGYNGTGSGEELNGYIAEILVVHSVLSTSDREKLEGYLAHKWGLTANLPSGHPYKTLPPTSSTGSWVSNNTAVATINNSGVITGVTAGSATFTYTNESGCSSTTNAVTVNAIPTITATTPASRCETGTVTLGATASAGTINWYAAATGGSSLGTGTSFTTPSISATTIYYVDATNNGCTTVTRTAVTATVNTIPTITATTPAARCGTGIVSLGATASAGSINWYAAATGGSSLGSGTSFTTPSISATTIYYVDATDNGCTTATRTAVTATVNTIPTITATTPASRCETGTVTLGATASAGTINWYAAATGGSSLGTGTSFTTPSISATTIYYVDATDNGCTTATRTAVTATVTAIPTITATTPASRCGTGTVTLGATASAGTINWYAAATGGSSLGSGTSFTTPSNSATTIYYVEAIDNGCITATRTAVTATVNAIATITATTPASRCGTGTVTLVATASAGTINWYAAATGGSSLGSGTSFTTPIISSTTIYYVDATSNDCTTATRTAVTATVSVSPTISLSESSVCIGSNITANREWTPANLGASLALWLDASDATTVTQSSGLVSQWNDKSGNSRHATQATSTNMATYIPNGMNSKNVINFDGTTDFFNINLDFLANTSHSSFILTKVTTFSNIYGAANGGLGSASLHIGMLNSSSYRVNYWGNDFGPNISANFKSGQGNVLNYIWIPGGNKQVFANGVSEGTSPGAGTPIAMSGGGRISNIVGQGHFGGDISEIIMLTTVPSTADREKLEGYLAHKWGLTANLPSGHPYKTLPPTSSTGSWVSNNTAVATINNSGVITGVTAGSATFTYTNESGCSSTTNAVTVNAIPTITATTPASRCETGTVTLGATASAGTINWYAAATGGSSLGTGTSFTTPSISATTNYYVDATNNGCTTVTRTAVTATVNAIPPAPTAGMVTQPTCAVATGFFQITAHDNTKTYNFNPSSGVSISPTGLVTANAGTYTFSVTNTVSGCTSVASANIVVNVQPTAPAAPEAGTVTQPTASQAIGTFQIKAFDASRTYNFTPSVVSISATGLVTANAGTYTFTVDNAAGCFSIDSMPVTVISFNVNSGNSGGVESESLGDIMSKQYVSRKKSSVPTEFVTSTAAKFIKETLVKESSSSRIGNSDLKMLQMFPSNLQDGDVSVISSPTDILDYTIAQEVLSVDFSVKGATKAVVLGVRTKDKVYNHTKASCDRLRSAEILNVKTIKIGGYNFLIQAIKQRNAVVEYAVSFAVGKNESDSFYSLQSNWYVKEYGVAKDVFNFQVWATTLSQTTKLVNDILNNLKASIPLNQTEIQKVPKTFVSKVTREGSDLVLKLKSVKKQQDVEITMDQNYSETNGYVERRNRLQSEFDQTLRIKVGDSYEFDGLIKVDGNVQDAFYHADGNWGLDFDTKYTKINNYRVSNNFDRIGADDEMLINRDVHLEVFSENDYATLYKSLLPAQLPADYNEYKYVSFKAKGSGLMELGLIKSSVENWKHQYKAMINIGEEEQTYYVPFKFFTSSKSTEKINANDLTMLTFTFLPVEAKTKNLDLTISDVKFSKKAPDGYEDLLSTMQNQFIAYPNPSVGNVKCVLFSDVTTTATVSLYDISGKTVYSSEVQLNEGKNELDFNFNVPKGVMFLSIKNGKTNFGTSKISFK